MLKAGESIPGGAVYAKALEGLIIAFRRLKMTRVI
jgi:hypothetical protein